METTKQSLVEIINLLYSKIGISHKDLDSIINTLKTIQEKNPYGISEAIDIIDAIGGFTPETIHKIAVKCDKAYYAITEKPINYFKQVIKSTASEPTVRYVSSMLKVNY